MADRKCKKFISSTDFLEKFWALVDIKDEDDCWLWLGNNSATILPYGIFYRRRIEGKFYTIWAHHVSFILANGSININLDIMHSCDNSLCENPKHLSQGTRSQNIKDCFLKGRRSHKGFNSPSAKLTEQEALEIYYNYLNGNITGYELAKLYKVKKSIIYNIINKQHWATKDLHG